MSQCQTQAIRCLLCKNHRDLHPSFQAFPIDRRTPLSGYDLGTSEGLVVCLFRELGDTTGRERTLDWKGRCGERRHYPLAACAAANQVLDHWTHLS